MKDHVMARELLWIAFKFIALKHHNKNDKQLHCEFYHFRDEERFHRLVYNILQKNQDIKDAFDSLSKLHFAPMGAYPHSSELHEIVSDWISCYGLTSYGDTPRVSRVEILPGTKKFFE